MQLPCNLILTVQLTTLNQKLHFQNGNHQKTTQYSIWKVSRYHAVTLFSSLVTNILKLFSE